MLALPLSRRLAAEAAVSRIYLLPNSLTAILALVRIEPITQIVNGVPAPILKEAYDEHRQANHESPFYPRYFPRSIDKGRKASEEGFHGWKQRPLGAWRL